MSTPIAKEWVAAYFDYGVDRANRRIFLCGDVDSGTISYVIQGIYFMEAEDPKKEITIFLNTDGGELYEMFALYDVLQTVTCPIATMSVGRVMSAGVLLAAAGSQGQRWAGPNCWFMLHSSSGGVDGSVEAAEKEIAQWKKMNTRWYELLAKHSKKSPAQWRALCRKSGETYFSSEDAMEYGLIDNLWNEREGE